jgi:hypothetical protein
MHWHYKLNHPSHIVMTKMAKQNMLPRRITKILTNMDKQHTKPPMCNDCCGAKATKRPWRNKSAKHNQRHLKKATYPGEVISVEQLESSIPGFIGQMTGKLTRQCIVASTVFVDHASEMRPRTKHLNIKYHHFREEVRKGTISIYHTRTEDQIADIFTKPLPEASFVKFREKMMGW